MNGLCDSAFWDRKLIWDTDDPDFTICFEKSVLVWFPCLFLWLMLPLEIYYLNRSKAQDIPLNVYNCIKLAAITIVITLSLVELIHYTLINEVYIPVNLYSPLIKIITFGLFFCLTYANIKLGIRSSGILFMFTFLLTLCGLPQFRTELRSWNNFEKTHNTKELELYFIYYPTIIILFILNCFVDAPPRIRLCSLEENSCPENESSFISKLFFSWFDPMVLKGYKRPLENADLWDLDYSRKPTYAIPIFEKHWESALKKARKFQDHIHGEINSTEYQRLRSPKQVSIIPSLSNTFLVPLTIASILKVFQDLLGLISPQILSLLIDFVQGNEPLWHGYLYACLLFIVAVGQTLCLAHYYHKVVVVGFHARACLMSVIYKKALRLSNIAKTIFTTGEVINLMAVDAQRFCDLSLYLVILFLAPIKIFLALYFLWQILGFSVIAGLATMLIVLPINARIVSKVETLQTQQMEQKDNRVKIINEILSGIKVLKLYAWESNFEDQVLNIRNKELKILKKQIYFNAAISFLWMFTPFVVSAASFIVFILSNKDNVLDVKTAFVSISLFNILRQPLSLFPSMISYTVQTGVSVKRINKFLNSEELDSDAVLHEDKDQVLSIENGTFSWDGYDGSHILKNININVESGKLIAVVGPVGCGKSSLISAFLGDMYKLSGTVNTKGTIAYVPQQAWIQNQTLKYNITFDTTVSNSYYETIIEACALKADLDILPAGDATEIGEKGINLSGGQKQRISLARAVCFQADIYFLDDPLSAVDSYVGKHIFDHVIGPKGILRDKTRIFITHNLSYLPQVDHIIVLKNGSISESGTLTDLLSEKKGDFAEFFYTYIKTNDTDWNIEDLNKLADVLEKVDEIKEITRRKRESESDSVSSLTSQQILVDVKDTTKKNLDGNIAGQNLIEIEKIETGNVDWKVYRYYLISFGTYLICIIVILNILYEVFQLSTNFWLSKWSSDSSMQNGTRNIIKQDLYLGGYTLLGLAYSVTEFFADVALRIGCWKSSIILHNMMLHNILRVPLVFMDVTPIGRILSRFSKDIEIVDSYLSDYLSDLIASFGDIIATLFTISYSTPAFLPLILPIGCLYFIIQRLYVTTSRQLKRLESVSRSPIYSHFGETINGAESIRSYRFQNKFISKFEEKVDFNTKCGFISYVSNRWLAIRLESIGSLIIFFSALFAVRAKNTISSGLVGLSVSYAMQISSTLSWLIRMVSEMENNIVAVERIKEYGEIPQEAAWELSHEHVPANWPDKGEISFKNFQVRYRDGLELVLRGITFQINGGEKVGVVGRTGAGKSSLTLSLFRIIESAGGKIYIDGIDITTLGLHTLRSRITIIPQDPVLFSGTLRMNLDPAGHYNDENIWRALELAHLKKYILDLPDGLMYKVTEGGSNFSVGQRQLICLARALLRKTKILILDEATAAVDMETDSLLQTTIRKEFSHCTVLTIAHRLNTIMDYDRVLVLDQGNIVEFDKPSNLLELEDSVFYKMAAAADLL